MSIIKKAENKKEYVSRSEDETFRLAEKIAQDFKGDEIVLLTGELGAGKTVFAKGIASGLGYKDIHNVCSPSFTLVNIYEARFTMYHIDLYRLGTESEIDDLGLEDFIGQGVVVVEWGEKVHWNMDVIRVTIKVDEGDERKITLS